jgi:hypothetical protein
LTNRVCGDSTTLADIPLHVDIAMVYATGHLGVVSVADLEARFPHHRYGHAWVDVDGTMPHVGIRDWENGDKSGSLSDWVGAHNDHAGERNAVVYSNVSTIPEVRDLTGKHILGRDYYLFVATLDGIAYRAPGVIACQRDGTEQTRGHWDRSFVYDHRFWQPVKHKPEHKKPNPQPNQPARPGCRSFQLAIRATVDDRWGSNTDLHATALIDATKATFPRGVEFAQRVVGATADGVWGPKSQEHLFRTVVAAQTALAHMGFDTGGADGVWGPKTEEAYKAARKACHI